MSSKLAPAVALAALLISLGAPAPVEARLAETRALAGTLQTDRGALPEGATIEARWNNGEQRASAGPDGRFRMVITRGAATLRVTGPGIRPFERRLAPGDDDLDLPLELAFPGRR